MLSIQPVATLPARQLIRPLVAPVAVGADRALPALVVTAVPGAFTAVAVVVVVPR